MTAGVAKNIDDVLTLVKAEEIAIRALVKIVVIDGIKDETKVDAAAEVLEHVRWYGETLRRDARDAMHYKEVANGADQEEEAGS